MTRIYNESIRTFVADLPDLLMMHRYWTSRTVAHVPRVDVSLHAHSHLVMIPEGIPDGTCWHCLKVSFAPVDDFCRSVLTVEAD